jgi:hypothetical protein
MTNPLQEYQDTLLVQRVAAKGAAPKWDRSKVRGWMTKEVVNHVDRKTDEVNTTSLAEAAASEFNVYEDTRDYKIPDDLFDLSTQVGEAWEKKNKRAATGDQEAAYYVRLAMMGKVPTPSGDE